MKITYNKNPLKTVVELDDYEKEVFRLKIKVKELEEDLGSASIYLDPKNASWVMNATPRRPNGHTLESLIEEVRKDYLDMDYMYGEKDEEHSLDKRVETLLEHYLEELKGWHVGDCTCVACSCSKCHAESILGIDTIKGLGKHSAYKVDGAFGKNNEKTIDEALESLRNYDPKPTGPGWDKLGGYEQYVPRWKAEAASAYEWLLNYRNTHFKD